MTSAMSLRMAGLWFLQFDWILQSLSVLVGCVNIQCALDRKTHFCIKCNLTVSHLRTHTVWILLQSVSLVKQRAKEEPHLTATRRRNALQTMAFLFRGIFQPLRPPSASEMPEACGWQLLTSFQIVLLSPNLDSSRMVPLSQCWADLNTLSDKINHPLWQPNCWELFNFIWQNLPFFIFFFSGLQDVGSKNQTVGHWCDIHSLKNARI